MTYRRGFKAEANAIVREVRRELRVMLVAPLDPRRLAEHLEIPILPLGDLATVASNAVTYFHSNPELLSALTVFEGTRRLIVHNERHSDGRTNANIAHELAHALLFHEPTPAFASDGARNWNPEVEQEAVWLGNALLVPEQAALHVVRSRIPIAQAARTYNVSESVMVMRINVTGARARVARASRA